MKALTLSGRRHFLAHVLALVVFLFGFGCGGPREEFLGSRVEDRCNTEWPVCDKIVGCLLGDSSYFQGRFPGNGRFAVQVFEPSTVTVSFFLEDVTAAGEETVINFHEDRCRARIRQALTGKALLGESEKTGIVKREADLSGIGDHLIEYESDARAAYMVKVDVLPTRLKEQ
jgi:hypothetical protein